MSITTGPLRVHSSAPLTFLAPCLSRHRLHAISQTQPTSSSSNRRQASTSASTTKPKSTSPSTKRLVPPPTPFCPDAPTFLSLIGRNMSQHASKFGDWETLFRTTSGQMKEMGIEPSRNRRYLLWWRDQFRRGHYGIGGDMVHVSDGVGVVRTRLEPDGSRVAVNVPAINGSSGGGGGGDAQSAADLRDGVVVRGLTVAGPGNGVIRGSHFAPVGGLGADAGAAQIKAAEGIWEIKRGRKIYGGERRRKNVLSRIAARARGTLT